MPVHIGEITTEVVPEAEPLGAAPVPKMDWQEIDRTAQLISRQIRDRLRTAAEGFDD